MPRSRKRRRKEKTERDWLSRVMCSKGRVLAEFYLHRGDVCWRIHRHDDVRGDEERIADGLAELLQVSHEVAYAMIFKDGRVA